MPAEVTASTITAALASVTDRDQWVCWREEQRDGDPTKVPVKPFNPDPGETRRADHGDPSTWRDCKTALACHRVDTPRTDGIGYVFATDGPLVGIDLDDCRDPDTGAIQDWARDIVQRLDSYTEISPSGTGLHVLVRGELPPDGRKHGDVEMYDEKRFFTVTGAHLDQTPRTIHDRQDALAAVHEEYFDSHPSASGRGGDRDGDHDIRDESWVDDLPDDIPTPDELKNDTAGSSTDPDPDQARERVRDLSDKELVERAKAANDGGKFDALWTGRWQATSAPSHSEADMMLACKLAFWTAGDPQRMDRLFRQSGLMRDKWDEVHYASGDTYGERCLAKAVQQVSDVYTPPEPDDDQAAAFDPDILGDATDTATGHGSHSPTPGTNPTGDPAGATASPDHASAGHEDAAGSPDPAGAASEAGTDGATAEEDGGRHAATTDATTPADTASTAAAPESEPDPDPETATGAEAGALAEKDARIEDLEAQLEQKRQRIMVLQDKVREFRERYRAAEADDSTGADTVPAPGTSQSDTDTRPNDTDQDDRGGPMRWLRDRFS